MNRNNIGFFVDKVSEDSFYQNLLLGLPNVLDKLPNIYDKKLKRYPPATKSQVKSWEYSNGVNLPQDLHELYLSCDGLLYTYTFYYEPSNREDIDNKMYARIEINPIKNLSLIDDYEIKPFSKIFHDGISYQLELSEESKVFELSDNGNFKVTLVYPDRKIVPSIWIFRNNIFHYIANDVTTYLRMAVAHLGVPGWQFIFSPLTLPGRSREMLNIIAPGVLYRSRNPIPINDEEELNKINSNLFDAITDEMNGAKKCNDTMINKQLSTHTIDRKPSSATIGKKSSTATIGRKASSANSSYSEKLKKKTFSKRRPFTPRF